LAARANQAANLEASLQSRSDKLSKTAAESRPSELKMPMQSNFCQLSATDKVPKLVEDASDVINTSQSCLTSRARENIRNVGRGVTKTQRTSEDEASRKVGTAQRTDSNILWPTAQLASMVQPNKSATALSKPSSSQTTAMSDLKRFTLSKE